MSINLSDYQHAGIFVEEVNNSVVDRPVPQEAIINFVPGFSRKGTVFNRPVLIKVKSERNKYFGDIDRYLEKKGSFFHRTIEVALNTGPVWAMNLLKTNSLDTLNYISVSLSSQYDNDVVLNRQYDDFFNKAGFWQRDTDSFLFFAQNAQRMIHFTNVGDGAISVFMFKSPAAGFNLTAELWYGGIDKVPTWINKNDLISDYMVRVVVVKGNWNNYTTLAADPNYSKYFTSSGIRKDKVDAFVRDSAVTLLAQYDGSLIPYFQDANKRNIFIESLINTDTDATGLFCTYDIDKVETDLPNGRIDIIGQTLVDLNKPTINFMSYQDTIEEVDAYTEKSLDVLSNVSGLGSITTRTTLNANQTLSGLTLATAGLATSTPAITVTSTSGQAIINNTIIPIVTATYNFSAIPTPASNSTYRIDTLYIDQNGLITVVTGTTFNYTTGTIEATVVAAGLTYPASMPNNAIVYGYLFREKTSAAVDTSVYVPVALQTSGYVPLTIGTLTTNDLQVQTSSTNVLDIKFLATATATKANYKAWRRVLFFNELATKKILSNSVIIDNVGSKVDLSTAVWTDNYTAGTGDKEISLTVGVSSNIRTQAAAGSLVFYFTDNEFKYTSPFVTGNLSGLETRNTVTGTSGYGVVAKLSNFYLDFYNGRINTGDYFYTKLLQASTTVKFVHYANLAHPNSIGDYLIMSTSDAAALGIGVGSNNFNAYIQTHPANTGNFLLSTGQDNSFVGVTDFAPGLVADSFLAAGQIAFRTSSLVATYTLPTAVDIYDYSSKLYLKMYTVGTTLKVDFMADNTLTTPGSILASLLSINTTLSVYSGEAAYTQTLEIEQNSGYTITDTKFLIDSVRYPEIAVGNYVKAFYNPTLLAPGEYPKKFARIIKKQPWSGNTVNNVNYQEITTDIKVDVEIYGSGDYQTTRYTTLEDYVSTYKAITLNGFVTQATSWPDGTEQRQSDVLDVVAKETSLWWALVNKNKFNFRYLVDSFGLGLTAFSKQQLVDITGKRKNCLAFINMPSKRSFINSTNPSFINTDGTLNTEYVN
jgi:hypothetical protein